MLAFVSFTRPRPPDIDSVAVHLIGRDVFNGKKKNDQSKASLKSLTWSVWMAQMVGWFAFEPCSWSPGT